MRFILIRFIYIRGGRGGSALNGTGVIYEPRLMFQGSELMCFVLVIKYEIGAWNLIAQHPFNG